MAPDCKWLVASTCRFSVALICACLAAGWPLPLSLSSPPFYYRPTNLCRKLPLHVFVFRSNLCRILSYRGCSLRSQCYDGPPRSYNNFAPGV